MAERTLKVGGSEVERPPRLASVVTQRHPSAEVVVGPGGLPLTGRLLPSLPLAEDPPKSVTATVTTAWLQGSLTKGSAWHGGEGVLHNPAWAAAETR